MQAMNFASDTIIAAVLVGLLWRQRTTGFPQCVQILDKPRYRSLTSRSRTHTIVHNLILYTVTTGVLSRYISISCDLPYPSTDASF